MKRAPFGEGEMVLPASLPSDPVARARALSAAARREIDAAPPGTLDVVSGADRFLLVPMPAGVRALSLPDPRAPRTHTIAVRYDGPDLARAASLLGLAEAEIVERHASGRYVALLAGFMPGFAYLGGLDPALAIPRLPQPRKRVPASAVAIAGPLTAVYPFASPGGWNLIGEAIDPALFDPSRAPPARIGALDEVVFVPSDAAPGPRSAALGVDGGAPVDPHITIESVRGLATVQDRGRFGHRSAGLGPSGPLDVETFAAANAALGNAADAAAIEVVMLGLTLVAEREVWISVDGAPAKRLSPGERLVVDPRPRLCSYLAIAGGVDVPAVLGSRSTFVVAGLGGHRGRPLARGDRLAAGAAVWSSGSAARCEIPGVPEGSATLSVTRGLPDDRLPDGAFEALVASRYRVSSALDRVGTRLEGATVPRVPVEHGLPDPVLPGAIQITHDGTPIVLGPDAAVTGGYPVVGLLSPESAALLGRLRPGHPILLREG